jgi:NADH-ubiquinone oxidoreductase chain 5
MNSVNNIKGSLGRRIYTFLNGKYLVDVVYNKYFIDLGLKLGITISKVLDRGIIELLGPFGLSNLLMNTAANISRLDTGIVTSYALYIVLGLISILFILFYPVIINGDLFTIDHLLYNSYITEIRLIFIFISSLFLINTKS